MEAELLGWAQLNSLLQANKYDYIVAGSVLADKDITKLGGWISVNLSFLESNLNQSRIRSLDKESLKKYILASCTFNHEMRHIHQVSSTTFGLWNVNNCLSLLGLAYQNLLEAIQLGCDKIYVPVMEWVNKFEGHNGWESPLEKLYLRSFLHDV